MRVSKTNKSTLQEDKLLHLQEKARDTRVIERPLTNRKFFEMGLKTTEESFPKVLEIEEETSRIWKQSEKTKLRRVGWMIDKED